MILINELSSSSSSLSSAIVNNFIIYNCVQTPSSVRVIYRYIVQQKKRIKYTLVRRAVRTRVETNNILGLPIIISILLLYYERQIEFNLNLNTVAQHRLHISDVFYALFIIVIIIIIYKHALPSVVV